MDIIEVTCNGEPRVLRAEFLMQAEFVLSVLYKSKKATFISQGEETVIIRS